MHKHSSSDPPQSPRQVFDRGRVFISYRREGGYEMARLIYDELKTKRGYHAYMDVEGLKSGPFTSALLSEIGRSTDVIVVLSPGSLARCHEPEDWLRKEVSHAIKLKKNVVPVMLRGFKWPEEALPIDMQSLSGYHGLEPSPTLFEASMGKLASMLIARPSRRRVWIKLAVSVAILTLCGVLVWAGPYPFGPSMGRSVNVVTSRDIEELSLRVLAISAQVSIDPFVVSDSTVELTQLATRVREGKRYAEEAPGTVAAVYRLTSASLLFHPSGTPDREQLRQGVFWLEKLGEINPHLEESLHLKEARRFFLDYVDGRTRAWDAERAADYALSLGLLQGSAQEIEQTKKKVLQTIGSDSRSR